MSIRTLPRYSRGRGRFSREGNDGGGGGTGGQAGGAGAAGAGTEGGGGGGYTPPATQAELDRIVQERVRRAEARFADYDSLKEKAARAEALELELGTDAEKAAAKAREEARAEANGHWTPRVVRAEFRAEAKGVLTDDQLGALLEDLDLSKYVGQDNEPDRDKIAKKVKAFAPTGGSGGGNGQQQRHINLGQGNQPPAVVKKGDAGRAMAKKLFGEKANSASSTT